jgi:hypothetical protein
MSSLLKSIADSQLDKQRLKSTWGGSLFESMDPLKPDYSGKVGECLLAGLCRIANIDHIYDDTDKNSTDGTYDIIILGKKIEVKTARLGAQNGFQHENLRATGCDLHILIDIKPNEFFISVVPKFSMTARHSVFGRTPHLRKGTTDVYKFDFCEENLIRAVRNGITLRVETNTSIEEIGAFLKNQIERESVTSSS